jgi:hypothetical protein
MPSIAVIRPDTPGDIVEPVMALWPDAVIGGPGAQAGISFTDVRGQAQCTASNASAAMRSTDATLYFGHGTRAALGMATTLVDSTNVSAAAGKMLLAFACEAALTLGPDAIAKRVTAFLGFADIVAVVSGLPADPIGDAVNRALTVFVQGGTVDDVRDVLISELKQVEADYAGPLSYLPGADITWLSAHVNWRSVTVLGTGSAKL